MKFLITMAIAAVLAGCALPATQVKTGAQRPALAVRGAPAGSILYVDGLQIGEAVGYDGKSRKLTVEEGAHRVEIKQGNSVLHTQQVFVGTDETAVVEVSTGVAR